jgi:hypothetical protein
MFVKENKFEVTGMGDLVKPKVAPPKKIEPRVETKLESKDADVFMSLNEISIPTPSPASYRDDSALLNFDLNVTGN